MIKTCFLSLLLFAAPLSVSALTAQQSNQACIAVIKKYRFMPPGYELLAMESGEVLTVAPGKPGTLFVIRGTKDRRDFYQQYQLDGKNCNQASVSSGGETYLETGLAKYVSKSPADPNVVQEIKSACRMAPGFSEQIRSFESLHPIRSSGGDAASGN